MTTDDTPTLGWCTGYKDSHPGMRPQYWYIYMHTPAGCYKLDGITFPNQETTRRWAIRNLPGLPEFE